MNVETDALEEFRHIISRRARQSPTQWEDTRRLIERDVFPATLDRLRRLSLERELAPGIKEQLDQALPESARRVQELDSGALKLLTGLPPTKAFRALCVYFELIEHPSSRWPIPTMSSGEVEQCLRERANPFDLLLHSDVASVLDLGAGDLSFAGELAEQYGPRLQQRGRHLVLHCVDRLDPQSKLGGPLHPGQERIRTLQEKLGPSFGFFGNQDMFDLKDLDDQGKLARRYTIVTCWAPATPTFAYEPTRLSEPIITGHLRRTKGSFQHTRYDGEPALEVQHGERALLFPSWKFEIVGPLALLNLLAHRGSLCVLGAVDAQVFWEILSQLLEEPRFRPQDQPFSPDNLPEIFGDVFRVLDRLPFGQSINLSDLGTPRKQFPATEQPLQVGASTYSFRQVAIRRGATFPGIPASSTARTFSSMAEEVPPWFITLIPNIT